MTCHFCKTPLRGFQDSQPANVDHMRVAVCRDMDRCAERVFANERSKMGLSPKRAADAAKANGNGAAG